MHLGFACIYYLEEIAAHRANAPGWKSTGDFLKLRVHQRRGRAGREGA
jgi:hypothetical protein